MADSTELRPGEALVDLRWGWAIAIVIAVLCAGVAILAGASSSSARAHWADHLPDIVHAGHPAGPGTLAIEPPPWQSEEVLDSIEETGQPCSGCHNQDLEPNPTRRELNTHDDIVLRHDEQNRWCLDCHDEKNRDKLRLASGKLIDYSESHLLCGQCHGDKHRDWRAGIHGRRTGSWNGDKTYSLCVHCHWAHAPRYQPMKPLPPPKPQGEIR